MSDSGEGRWTSIAAIEAGHAHAGADHGALLPLRIEDMDDFENRLLSAMRKQFGGHDEKTA